MNLPVPYIPKFQVTMANLANVGSAWVGIDRILHDIVARFQIRQRYALEFGVEFGYSTSALANIFEWVTGVDTFRGDVHSSLREDHFLETSDRLRQWPNIALFQTSYQDWIKSDHTDYDLIHIDIVHNYDETLECGLWSVDHAPVVLFHDTESFPDVKRAVTDIAAQTGREFYNYEPCHGLGILVKQ